MTKGSGPGQPKYVPTAPVPGRRGVLIVASPPVLRLGLAAMLRESRADGGAPYPADPRGPGALVVQEAVGTFADALRLLAAYRPPLLVLVVDPPLPDAAAGEALQRLAADHPATGTLVLMLRPDPSLVRHACALGVRGVHDLSVTSEDLCAALLTIDSGDVAVQPSLVRHLLEEDETATTRGTAIPTRELTLLQLLARGYASKQIAPLLTTTPKAIDLLVERAARRLGAANRTQAVAVALRRGLIT